MNEIPPAAKQQPTIKRIEFVPVSARSCIAWSRPASYAFAAGLSRVPIADSELLLTSHHLPVAIDNIHEEPRVVALTNPRFQRAPVISEAGAWLKGYMPIALRCLPFRLSSAQEKNGEVEVAANMDGGGNPRLPIYAQDGTLSPEVKQISALLGRLESGRAELRQAAESLLMADVVTPFHLARLPGKSAGQGQFFTVDQNRFSALSPSRAALLMADGFLPIDLAVACIFSQRLMTTLIEFTAETPRLLTDERPHEWDAFSAVEQLEIRVDGGDLFSFQSFAQACEQDDEHDRHSLRS